MQAIWLDWLRYGDDWFMADTTALSMQVASVLMCAASVSMCMASVIGLTFLAVSVAWESDTVTPQLKKKNQSR